MGGGVAEEGSQRGRWRDDVILNRAVRGHLTQALRDVRDGRVGLRGESIPGGRTIPCKGPEAGTDRGGGGSVRGTETRQESNLGQNV